VTTNRNVERAINQFMDWGDVATRYDKHALIRKHALIHRDGTVLAAILPCLT
jgi:hypothetical protein